MNLSSEWLLQLGILIPAISIFGIVAADQKPNLRETISLSACFLHLYCIVELYQLLIIGEMIHVFWWEIFPGIAISFLIEPLGMLFAMVVSFLWSITTIYAIGYLRCHHEKNQTRFYAFFAFAISATIGIAFASNLLTLFIFYELLTLSTYPLVTHTGTKQAKNAGRIYLAILLGTSIIFLLFAIAATWFVAETLDFKSGGIFASDIDLTLANVLLVLFVYGIGKAAIMPFHRWLPAAMVAPTPVSALLHAVAVVKAGVFTLLKISGFIFGFDLLTQLSSTQIVLYIAAASVLLASLIALRQDNLKALLAYSTVSQLGYISIGALLANSAGVIGSAMHIATHALGKITLFFCAGAILVTVNKSRISEMHGLGRQMPITMAAFFIASLSIIGLPPTGGTWSKWFLLMGVLESQQWILLVVLMISSLLNIAYLLPISFHAFFSTNKNMSGSSTLIPEFSEAPAPLLLAIGITTLGCVGLFVYPQPVYELVSTLFDVSGTSYAH